MKNRYRGLGFPFITLSLLMLASMTAGLSFAQDVPMGTFRKEFEQKMGKPWETATPEEKRGFVRQYNGTPDKIRTTRSADPAETKIPDQRRAFIPGTTLEIRTKFNRKTGKNWTEATLEEQKKFLEEFQKKEQKNKQIRKRNLQRKIAAQKKAKQQKNAEIQRKERAKQKAQAERQKRAQQLAKESEAERKKLDAAMKQLEKRR